MSFTKTQNDMLYDITVYAYQIAVRLEHAQTKEDLAKLADGFIKTALDILDVYHCKD